ncbi:tRNA (cytosine(32)/uridine(32)-2'-O)-methyltransferase TrmJ [Shewanella avicenniae]|uniref:tRNA (cytidine/uridine-2'-O-)-methyltransferase TrmJ n=1 Tax=Shewanella avicenniae TaxID=2814294 RepID=A0ABX7QVK7_9GAMM|nr:tRNA (cytosine(32)/uridine(32)-2'-O)-methyltransferase TrmJ [Shewanella avicenniae]QSX34858.1 tRNA (cytosine(32)/uridine(32)-2'-O)-methyltransferase TrmJ [Shewanella avicenniae]
MLSNIRVVLVGTTHSGNIGSVARAMKTMGLSSLYLAEPKVTPDGQSIALAAGASDILKDAVTVDNMAEAIKDCSLVIATSARSRTLEWPVLEPREAAKKLVEQSANGNVAIVFGRERNGLSNEELQMCHYHLAIPANSEYSSLNLAQAVQIVCYETRMAYLDTQNQPEESTDVVEYPSVDDQERFYEHLQRTLTNTGFIIKNHPGHIMQKLRRLFSKARIEAPEMNILRGILTSVDKATQKQKSEE